jgi:hypothetical protein
VNCGKLSDKCNKFPKRENPSCLIVFGKRKDYPSSLEKIILPQRGKDVPHLETSTGKGIQGFFKRKMDSTISTRAMSSVTQLGIV